MTELEERLTEAGLGRVAGRFSPHVRHFFGLVLGQVVIETGKAAEEFGRTADSRTLTQIRHRRGAWEAGVSRHRFPPH